MQRELVQPAIVRNREWPRVLRPLLETFAWFRNIVIRDLFIRFNDSTLSRKGALEIRQHKIGRKRHWLDGTYFGG
jgi:hypothetical protein